MDEILYWIVEIVSKGGNYLRNIGPNGKGVVPQESVDILQSIGKWMKVNGEAIYGSEKWKILREGPSTMEMKSTTEREKKGFNLEFTDQDFWFTKKVKSVYVYLHPATDGLELYQGIKQYREERCRFLDVG